MDVDLRKLRYFVAVAEELHFGRAAERLHIAQPVLSRQIRALESDLRAQLLVRDHRSTQLTEAGRQLLTDARPLLASAEALRRRVQRAAHGTSEFTIAFTPEITVADAARVLVSRHPELSIRVLRTAYDDQADVVREGRADVCFVRMPVDHRGLRLCPLFSEPRVAALPAGHPLAAKASLTVAELAAERLLQSPDAVPEWRDLPDRRGAARPGREPRGVEKKLERVAAGDGVVILPLSTASHYTRTDVVKVPVDGIGPSQVCLAWSSDRRSPLVKEFAEIAAITGVAAHPALRDRAAAAAR